MKKVFIITIKDLAKFCSIPILIFNSYFSTPCLAQDWSPVGSGVYQTRSLYYEAVVSALSVYNGKLYAGGFFDTTGSRAANNIAAWDGTNWSAVGSGIKDTGLYGSVSCMAVYNGKLYVGGSFDSAGGIHVNNIAAWDGTNWSAVGNGIKDTGLYGSVSCMAVYNGKLYVGGSFDSAGGIHVNNIAAWDGANWSAVGQGIKNAFIGALAGYDSVLYAGGSFDSAGGKLCNSIAQWNGTAWAPLGTGLLFYNHQPGEVNSLCMYKGNLYAGGFIDSAGGIPATIVAAWNGTKWDSVVSESLSMQGWPHSMIVSNGTLLLGGSFNYVNGGHTENVASWDGTNWNPIGNGIRDTSVYTLCVYNNTLYAGGYFYYSGSTYVNSIAKWDYPLGVNTMNEIVNTINIYPNPNNGEFTLVINHPEYTSGTQIIKIYDELGEKVYDEMMNRFQYDYEINLSSQPTGIYLYRVIQEDGSLLGEGKIIVQK